MSKKLTFEFVQQYFEDHNCELYEKEYINNHTLMRYRCDCGNKECKIRFNDFKKGIRCMECSGREKLTFEYVYNYFKEHDCKLLEKEYINNHTLMEYECNCGNSDCKISFASFRQGQRCMECYGNKKLTFKEVKKYFEDRDCELLVTEYINNSTRMEYECKCGNSDCKISFSKFKQGQRCIECSGCKKLTFKYVKQYFEDHDCELFETEYINNSTLMRYRCDCGNTDCKIIFSSFKQGHRCKKCGYKKVAQKRKLIFKGVKKYFEDRDCELFETEYINNKTLMKYRCDCGNTNCKITFNKFKNGQRCNKCWIERNSGKNNGNYDPDLTDEEREKGRSCPGLGRWRKDVCERDNNTCQICGEVEGILCAHHIEAYKPNKELRTVVSNGILLCEKHHIEFHSKYGYDCHREQLNEFLIAEKQFILV